MKKVAIEAIKPVTLGSNDSIVIGTIDGFLVDSQGNLYVADNLTGTVKRYSSSGKFIGEIPNKLSHRFVMTGISLDQENSLYISDLSTQSVYKFSLDGNLLDVVKTDSLSNFVMGYCRAWRDKLYIGVLEAQYTDMANFNRSYLVGVYNISTKLLVKRIGHFDSIYKKIIPLSPETAFDVDSAGNLYSVQVHSNKVYIYDKEGKQIGVIGGSPKFREPSSAVPFDKTEQFVWEKRHSHMHSVNVTTQLIITYYYNYKTDAKGSSKVEHLIDIYDLQGQPIQFGVELPGRLLFAKDNLLYIASDLRSEKKTIALYKILLDK
jgi:hypothetical protein